MGAVGKVWTVLCSTATSLCFGLNHGATSTDSDKPSPPHILLLLAKYSWCGYAMQYQKAMTSPCPSHPAACLNGASLLLADSSPCASAATLTQP